MRLVNKFQPVVLLLVATTSILQAQVTQNQNAPSWTPIETEGQPMDYKLYWAANSSTTGGIQGSCSDTQHNCEILATTADNELTNAGSQRVRPPAYYYFITPQIYPTPLGLETNNGGCGPYGYPTPSYVSPPSSMFTVSQGFGGIGSNTNGSKGLVMQGYLGGGDGAYTAPTGPNAGNSNFPVYSLAAAYVSSNPCSFGDQEYGFYADTTQSTNGEISGQEWVFYYSMYTNNGAGAVSTSGQPLPAQVTSPLVIISNITYCLTCGADAYYSMYIIRATDSPTVTTSDSGWDFRIQVINADYSFANCVMNVGGQPHNGGVIGGTTLNNGNPAPCTVDIPINNLPGGVEWPVNSDGTMYGLNADGTVGAPQWGTSTTYTSFAVAATQTSNWYGTYPTYTDASFPGLWVNGLWLGF